MARLGHAEKAAAILRAVEGTLKHEGMRLTDEERALVLRFARGEISEDEFYAEALALIERG
ncbi:hypothetical protein H1164_03910 [Thermoactinomyces daqus]|uniref:Antitoxin VbhA domain-containing protein n=1 Tax=Thermoactinomyces daqus TaxID=1329516 RepID=A0A7W1X8P2_9BACL|nr:hypothetical protein [Thermoactinomyces daqus]MBA4542047.1 hypothetical protein [Thermoactinomyces daqus]